jgi:SAM-dependent methyltransferase
MVPGVSVLTDENAAAAGLNRHGADSPPWSPASAIAETAYAYDSDSDDLAARQWEADFGTYLDEFVGLISDKSHPIVDAGCGAGRDVASLVARGFPCVGVDLSSGMLARAQARVLDPAATWLQADIRAIPLETGSAGGIWTNAALLHLDSAGRVAALREFRRLLLPGRPLFVSTLAGSGLSSRRTASGLRRWFWGTDLASFSEVVESLGFQIVSAETEAGVLRGEWVNVLALAP